MLKLNLKKKKDFTKYRSKTEQKNWKKNTNKKLEKNIFNEKYTICQ